MTPVSRRRRRNAGSAFRRRWRARGHAEHAGARGAARHRANGAGCAVNDAYASCANPLRLRRMEAPYGTWQLADRRRRRWRRDRGWTYSLVTADGGAVYWSEARPLEGGRDAIVVARARRRARRRDPGRAAAPAPACTSTAAARSPSTTARSYFCNDADQRVYRHARRRAGPITPEPAAPFGLRYADLRVAGRPRWSACASATASPSTSTTSSRSRSTARPSRVVLAAGHDFYAAPRVSPDGTQLAWLTWDHPRMPWEGSELWVAELATARRARAPRGRRAGGGDRPARVEPGRRPALQLRPHRLVEPLPRRLRAGDRGRGRDRRAAVGVRRVLVRVPGRRPDRLHGTSATGATGSRSSRTGALRYVPLELTRIVDLTTDGERALFVGASPTRSPRRRRARTSRPARSSC